MILLAQGARHSLKLDFFFTNLNLKNCQSKCQIAVQSKNQLSYPKIRKFYTQSVKIRQINPDKTSKLKKTIKESTIQLVSNHKHLTPFFAQ